MSEPLSKADSVKVSRRARWSTTLQHFAALLDIVTLAAATQPDARTTLTVSVKAAALGTRILASLLQEN